MPGVTFDLWLHLQSNTALYVISLPPTPNEVKLSFPFNLTQVMEVRTGLQRQEKQPTSSIKKKKKVKAPDMNSIPDWEPQVRAHTHTHHTLHK